MATPINEAKLDEAVRLALAGCDKRQFWRDQCFRPSTQNNDLPNPDPAQAVWRNIRKTYHWLDC